MVWIQMKYIWRPYTIQLSVIVLHISSFVQSSEFCPVLSVLHLQVCPVQRIISSCLLLSRTSSVLSSPMNSVQSSVSVSHLQVCPVQWIPSSCLLLSHIFRFVKFSEFFPAVCYCLTSQNLSSPVNYFQLSVTVSHISSFVQSNQFCPVLCQCLTSPGLSSPVNSF